MKSIPTLNFDGLGVWKQMLHVAGLIFMHTWRVCRSHRWYIKLQSQTTTYNNERSRGAIFLLDPTFTLVRFPFNKCTFHLRLSLPLQVTVPLCRLSVPFARQSSPQHHHFCVMLLHHNTFFPQLTQLLLLVRRLKENECIARTRTEEVMMDECKVLKRGKVIALENRYKWARFDW